MLPAICFSLDQSKILSLGKGFKENVRKGESDGNHQVLFFSQYFLLNQKPDSIILAT